MLAFFHFLEYDMLFFTLETFLNVCSHLSSNALNPGFSSGGSCSLWSEVKWKSLSRVQLLVTHGLFTPGNSLGQNTGVCIVHGILQARLLEWVPCPFSMGSTQPRDWTQVSHIAGKFFTVWTARGALHPTAAAAAAAKSLQSCPTLCDPIDSSPPGSSVHGIFQARVLLTQYSYKL